MPRAGLSRSRVVERAGHLANEVGWPRLTMARLAEDLGVRQPSLYKHVNGMDDLRRSVAVQARTELADILARASVGRSGDDAVRSLCVAYRRWAHAQPGRYEATLRAPDPGDAADQRASAAAVGVVLDVLAGYGLTGEDAVDATRALRSALHGFVSLEASGGFGLPVDVDRSFTRMVDHLTAALRRA